MAKILAVDDDNVTIGFICLYLSKYGHDVTTARNGVEALEHLNSGGYDILITDIIMPEMDGYDLIMHLLLKPARPKIIAMTAGAPTIDVETILETSRILKADETLHKPVTCDALISAVDRLLKPRTP